MKYLIQFNTFFIGLLIFSSASAQTKYRWLNKLHPDSLINRNIKLVPIPLFGVSPETGIKLGASLDYFFNTTEKDTSQKARDSYAWLQFLVTTRKQVSIEPQWQIFTPDEKWVFRGSGGYLDYNEYVWGFGNTTLSEKSYADIYYSRLFLRTRFLKNLGNQIFFGPQQNFSHTYKIRQTGAADTVILKGIEGEFGSVINGIGPNLVYDTRDNVLSPSSGWYGEFVATFHTKGLGSSYNYNEYLFDIRHYISLKKETVLGFQALATLTKGIIPWRELPKLGGGMIMRGMVLGRYRDNQMLAFQSEFRTPLNKFLKLAFFAAAGNIATSTNQFSLNDTKITAGTGLRILLNKKKKVYGRIDYGRTIGGGGGLYFKLGEAF